MFLSRWGDRRLWSVLQPCVSEWRCFCFYVQIFFSELKYTYIETNAAYTVFGLLCDIGGSFSLILGSTILTLCEFTDFLFIVASRCIKVRANTDVLWLRGIFTAPESDGSIVISIVFFLSTFNATTHEPLHLAWWNFARTWTSTTSRSLLNFKVKVKGQSRIVFWCFLCLHDAAATRGCMTRTKTTSRSLLNIKVIGQGHMFLWVFCLHDSRGQYLDLSEGFTCVNVYSSKWWQNTRFVHWRRQLWGTGARAPPRPPASYVLREQIRKMYKNNAIFAQLLSIIGPFLSFFCPQFSSGSNYSSQNAGTIANKFQLHAYFRFR